jgi:GT2 family glycosyltransferase
MKTTAAWSVVIPTYNGRPLLAKHLPAAAAILDEGDEIIVVDDASVDDTASWVKAQQPIYKEKGIHLRLCQHSKNQRFAQAVNTGVAAARHRWAFILNNDVTPLTKQLKEIVQASFNDNHDLFAVGCAEVGSLDPQATVHGRGTGGWRRGLLVHWYDADQSKHETLWTSGGSMIVDVAKFRELGGMDTLFYPAYEEDRDLSYRALKRGWQLWFAPTARVLHQHETTNQTVFGQRQMAIMSWKNQFLLVWKDIHDWPLWLSHWLWLPYHLIISNYRSHGAAGLGWWAACHQMAAARIARQQARQLARRSDRAVLATWSHPLYSES